MFWSRGKSTALEHFCKCSILHVTMRGLKVCPQFWQLIYLSTAAVALKLLRDLFDFFVPTESNCHPIFSQSDHTQHVDVE